MRRFVAIAIIFTVAACFSIFTLPANANGYIAGTRYCWHWETRIENHSDTIGSEPFDFVIALELRDTQTGLSTLGPVITVHPGEQAIAEVTGWITFPEGPYQSFKIHHNLTPFPNSIYSIEQISTSVDDSNCPVTPPSSSNGVFINPNQAHIGDGRLNDGPSDLAAPVASYCEPQGFTVYDISAEGHGVLAFRVTRAEIDAALAEAKSSGHNVLIAEGLGNSLYALSSNELTLVGADVKEPGKIYEHILPAGVCA